MEGDADDNEYSYDNTLSDKQRSGVLAGIAHFRHDGKAWLSENLGHLSTKGVHCGAGPPYPGSGDTYQLLIL